MVTTRTINRRRLRGHVPTGHLEGRRRRSTRAQVAQLSLSAAASRLRINGFARVYVASGLVFCLAVAYLVVAVQVTQSAYDLAALRAQGQQLQSTEAQLRYEVTTLSTPSRIAQDAQAAGLQQVTPYKYVTYQPVNVDLSAPIAPRPVDASLEWQKLLSRLATLLHAGG